MTTFNNSLIEPMGHASDSRMLVLTCSSKLSSTNHFLQNDSMVAISTQATPKMGVQVKIRNNISDVASAIGPTSPKTATHPIGSAPYNAKADVSSANSTTCIMTTSWRPVHIRDVA